MLWARRWFVGPAREVEEAIAGGVNSEVPGELERVEEKLERERRKEVGVAELHGSEKERAQLDS